MAATPACLISLLVGLTFLLLEGPAPASAESWVQRRRAARSLLRRLNKPPLASIQSLDGDVIDCVHITKQHAFDHPLLRNHTIQMRPSKHPGVLYKDPNIVPHPITQTWHENGNCPKNTIPIRRTKEEDALRASSIWRYGKKKVRSIPNLGSINDPVDPNAALSGHQYAVASAQVDKFYGTKATMNLWQPMIARAKDFSLTQLWISGGSYNGNNLNTIEAGWQVSPDIYGDNNPRIFVYWTSDVYKNGCYNLLCPGFVQTNNQIAIGSSLSTISTYGGTQYEIDILVWKDPTGGNWWLQVGNDILGYWPSSIFSTLADSASSIMWGGEVYSPDAGQTSTHMGSGHFPEEGLGKASYIRSIQVVDSSITLKWPSEMHLINENPNCYNVQNGTDPNTGTFIYYGGPGKNPRCT
ncbi:unnamed protein product [Alopecurus aequalis]